ncbi:unnamed protein product [Phaeothamnion confervicola]
MLSSAAAARTNAGAARGATSPSDYDDGKRSVRTGACGERGATIPVRFPEAERSATVDGGGPQEHEGRRWEVLSQKNVHAAEWTTLLSGAKSPPPPRMEINSMISNSAKMGVLHPVKHIDVKRLTQEFPAPLLARALREREDALHACSRLVEAMELGNPDEVFANMHAILAPFKPHAVIRRHASGELARRPELPVPLTDEGLVGALHDGP